jgi:predicted flap endonuclease-1-like 5' DNA nuclease
MARAASDECKDRSPTPPRESGIVDSYGVSSHSDSSDIDRSDIDNLGEREASPVASAVDIGMKRDDEFDIDTDDAAAHAASAPKAASLDAATPDGASAPGAPLAASSGAPGATASAATFVTPAGGGSEVVTDEAIIEVADDEIETADPRAQRQTLPSSASSESLRSPESIRSRPPAPPSVRPRSPSSSQRAWLPPPRHLSSAPPSSVPSSSTQVAGRAAGVDPWLLANRTLELSRANARVAELLEQVAYRDARITELERELARLQRKLEARAAEAGPGEPRSDGAPSATHEPEPPVVTQTRPAIFNERSVGGSERSVGSRDELSFDAVRLGSDPLDDVDTDDADDASEAQRDSDFVTTSRATGSEEDLQQISGIGPRFEAALRRHGITRLSQIAAWSDADVRQVAKALRIPKSRIVKGRWVEVAREVVGTRLASE